MYEKILELCKNNGITIRELEIEANLGTKSLDNIRRGHSPRIEVLISVANYFRISLDFLTNREVEKFTLSSKEKELVNDFRSMNEQGQTALLSAADGFANNGIYKNTI